MAGVFSSIKFDRTTWTSDSFSLFLPSPAASCSFKFIWRKTSQMTEIALVCPWAALPVLIEERKRPLRNQCLTVKYGHILSDWRSCSISPGEVLIMQKQPWRLEENYKNGFNACSKSPAKIYEPTSLFQGALSCQVYALPMRHEQHWLASWCVFDYTLERAIIAHWYTVDPLSYTRTTVKCQYVPSLLSPPPYQSLTKSSPSYNTKPWYSAWQVQKANFNLLYIVWKCSANNNILKGLCLHWFRMVLRLFEVTFSIFLPIQQDVVLHIQRWIIPSDDLHPNWLS